MARQEACGAQGVDVEGQSDDGQGAGTCPRQSSLCASAKRATRLVPPVTREALPATPRTGHVGKRQKLARCVGCAVSLRQTVRPLAQNEGGAHSPLPKLRREAAQPHPAPSRTPLLIVSPVLTALLFLPASGGVRAMLHDAADCGTWHAREW